VDAPTPRELDRYRDRADRFIADLDEEYYLNYSGQKDDFELAAVYERYAELTTLETARRIGAGDSVELARFAAEGYLGNLTRADEEKLGELEAALEATVDGETIPYRMLRPRIANEPDRGKRERLERARNELMREHLNPLLLDQARTTYAGAGDLGAPSYLELYRGFGYPLDLLADECRGFLDATERLFVGHLDKALREKLGLSLGEAERWDSSRLWRGSDWDAVFPGDRMLPALKATLGDLRIDLDAQENVHLDIEQRPRKTPRAYCFPIEVPDRVILMIQPNGGPDDWRALFHEAGHTEHFANTSASLSLEARRLGDPAVSEGWAALIENLVSEPAWLNRRLDVPRAHDFAAEAALKSLWMARRYAAKLLYELELHDGRDPEGMEERYVELLSDALKIAPSPADYLSDVDAGFYATGYLRSWAFEAQLRTYLREEFGSDWFARREAGTLLLELWELGNGSTADELLKDVAGTEIELAAVEARIRELLPALA
jgi:hypothetical protein